MKPKVKENFLFVCRIVTIYFSLRGIALFVPPQITQWALSDNWFLQIPVSIGFVAVIIISVMFTANPDLDILFKQIFSKRTKEMAA